MMRIPLLETYVSLVRDNRNFRQLWLSQVVSQLGDWFTLIASAALVARATDSGLAIGGLFLARLLPPFLLGPWAGVVADRFDRRKIMILSDLLRALIVPGFLLVQSERDIWLIYTLTILQLSLSAFFDPARSALLPKLVSRQELITANALSSVTWSTMLALGAALGGLVASLFGLTAAFLIDAATFIVSAWFVSQVNPTAITKTPQAAQSQGNGWQEFILGLRYLQDHPAVLAVALLKGMAALSWGGMPILEVMFAEKLFPVGHDGSGTLGLIYFVSGVGTGLGPLLARRLSGDNPVAMHWAILAILVAFFFGYLLIAWAPTLPLLLLAFFLWSLGGGAYWVYSATLLQVVAPNRFLGRLFAFDIAMLTLASSLSTLWVSWLRDAFGLGPQRITLTLAAIALMITLIWAAYLAFRFKPATLALVTVEAELPNG
jgi:MFS family permease